MTRFASPPNRDPDPDAGSTDDAVELDADPDDLGEQRRDVWENADDATLPDADRAVEFDDDAGR